MIYRCKLSFKHDSVMYSYFLLSTQYWSLGFFFSFFLQYSSVSGNCPDKKWQLAFVTCGRDSGAFPSLFSSVFPGGWYFIILLSYWRKCVTMWGQWVVESVVWSLLGETDRSLPGVSSSISATREDICARRWACKFCVEERPQSLSVGHVT